VIYLKNEVGQKCPIMIEEKLLKTIEANSSEAWIQEGKHNDFNG
jgi:hypothetical protein